MPQESGPTTPPTIAETEEQRVERLRAKMTRRQRFVDSYFMSQLHKVEDVETRAQGQVLQQTDTSKVGTGLWAKLKKANQKGREIGERAIDMVAKYTIGKPIQYGVGVPLLAGGLGVAGALGGTYMLGKTLWRHGSTTYKSRGFYDSMVNNFKLGKSHLIADKKK